MQLATFLSLLLIINIVVVGYLLITIREVKVQLNEAKEWASLIKSVAVGGVKEKFKVAQQAGDYLKDVWNNVKELREAGIKKDGD